VMKIIAARIPHDTASCFLMYSINVIIINAYTII
jgi:hypothetical protein